VLAPSSLHQFLFEIGETQVNSFKVYFWSIIFMNFEARGAAESFKVHKTWKTSVLSIREK
jgi:hypothetical protein